MTRLPLALGLVLLHAATLAAAQTTPTRGADQPTHRESAPADPPTLAGPSVTATGPRTLVVYEYGGGLQELGLPPAEAALELLDLDDAAAERVAHVLAERSMLAEQLIIDNFDLVSQGEAIEASANQLEKGVFFLQVIRALYPLIERGSLEDEIRPLLPEQTAAEYDALLDEYWHAVGKSRVEQAAAKNQKLRLRKAVREARRDQLGKEVELAAKRALESERFAVDYLTRGLDLSATQEERIKTLVVDFVARTMGEASEQDKGRLFGEVLAYLNEHQRNLLIERIKGL